MKSSFITESSSSSKTILIVDSQGVLGEQLIRIVHLQDESMQAVFITEGKPEGLDKTNIIPFQKNTAFIPHAPYAHIFIVYRGEELLRDMIPGVLEKAEKDGERVVIAVHFSLLSDPLFSRIGMYGNISLVVHGEIFGSKEFQKEGIVNALLHNAKSNHRMIVPGDGLAKAFLTHRDDVIGGMLRGALSTKRQAVILCYPKHPQTILRVAHEIQKNDPSIKLDFGRDIHMPEPNLEGEYLFERYPLKERIRTAYDELEVPKHSIHIPFLTHLPKKTALFSPVSAVLFVLLILLLPLFTSLAGGALGGLLLKHAMSEVEEGKFSDARRDVGAAATVLSVAEIAADITRNELSYIGKEEWFQKPASWIFIGKEASQAGGYAIDAASTYSKILTGKSKNPDEDMTVVVNDSKNAVALYQKLRAEHEINDTLDYIVATSGTFLDSMPKLLGFGKKATYLLLFQNNMELRPGGGFIGSYGIVTFSNGKIESLSIKDVYDADGQLKGHIEPPYPIRRYLPSVHMYLRDSNFSPDFTTSASRAAFLLSQETGEMVDGVIAVDVSFLQGMLRAVGPVYVSDYSETVTADNVFLLTESHAEKNSFAGSSQKKDFIRSLLTALQLKVSEKHVSYIPLLEAIKEGITEKHLLAAFADPSIQNIATVNGLSSSFWDDREETGLVVNDFLGISEANLGVNKANYFIKRKINQQVSVDEGGVVHSTVELKYSNASKEWPGGDYKNYLRLVLPSGSALTSVNIDGEEQTIAAAVTDPTVYEGKNFKIPKGLEVERTDEGDKTAYGFLVTIPSGGAVKTVTVSYSHPHKVSYEQQLFTYDLKLFKQPGTDTSPYTFTFFYPESFKPTVKPTGTADNGQSVTISSDTKTDRRFHLEFAKK